MLFSSPQPWLLPLAMHGCGIEGFNPASDLGLYKLYQKLLDWPFWDLEILKSIKKFILIFFLSCTNIQRYVQIPRGVTLCDEYLSLLNIHVLKPQAQYNNWGGNFGRRNSGRLVFFQKLMEMSSLHGELSPFKNWLSNEWFNLTTWSNNPIKKL